MNCTPRGTYFSTFREDIDPYITHLVVRGLIPEPSVSDNDDRRSLALYSIVIMWDLVPGPKTGTNHGDHVRLGLAYQKWRTT